MVAEDAGAVGDRRRRLRVAGDAFQQRVEPAKLAVGERYRSARGVCVVTPALRSMKEA